MPNAQFQIHTLSLLFCDPTAQANMNHTLAHLSYSHMPQFMSNSEGRTQSIVLNYGAARVTVAHFA